MWMEMHVIMVQWVCMSVEYGSTKHVGWLVTWLGQGETEFPCVTLFNEYGKYGNIK